MQKTMLTAIGLLGATALASGMLGSGMLASGVAEPRTGDIRELLDPTRVAASACDSARWAKNELFKPGVHLASLGVRAAAAAEGDAAAAEVTAEQLAEAWVGPAELLSLERL